MKTRIGLVALAIYVACIILANWAINHYGLVSVGFGLLAPAGVYFAAITFPARDIVQRSLGRLPAIAAILVGAAVSWWISSPTIAVASGVTFLISESLDMAIYTPLQRRFVLAVVVSSVIAAVVDSLVFLKLAGIPYSVALAGLIVGKLWIVLGVGLPAAIGLRRALPCSTSPA